MKYVLIDYFNGRVISKHRSALAVVRAQQAYVRAVKRANGVSAYAITIIQCIDLSRETLLREISDAERKLLR